LKSSISSIFDLNAMAKIIEFLNPLSRWE
jgi:hypothetical protein